jgi:hypothetical protein
MIGDLDKAKAMETAVRNKAARREVWLTRKWKTSGRGNQFMTLEGCNLTVFPNKFHEGKWSWSIDGKFSREPFPSAEAAKLDLFEAWNRVRETGTAEESAAPTPKPTIGGNAVTPPPGTVPVDYKRSGEQLTIIKSDASLLRVRAFAGTGKSSTLADYAAAHPDKTMLYLAFNKPVQLAAEQKFPKNVKCKTTHSLAWRFGKPYNEAGQLGENRTLDIVRELQVAPLRAVQIIETVNNYLCSASAILTQEHITDHPSLAAAEYPDILSGARILWEKMKDLRCSSVRMPHDGYLKLFQLSKPQLDFDVILFDEAQDANPATTDIVLRQTCQKVFVGDSHQSIYGFRGAEDALDKLPANETLYLTSSFRFGVGVANLSNMLLAEFKYEPNRLKGLGKHATTKFEVDLDKTYAFIARTNAVIFDRAVEMIGRRMHFVGGPAGYRFDRILDAYYLYCREPHLIKDPYYRRFNTFAEMEKMGEDTDDMEIKMLCKVVLKYTDAIPGLIEKLTQAHDASVMTPHSSAIHTTEPALIYSTAHKGKGLEFDQVVLADDFADLLNEKGQQCGPEEIEDEDINLLYVAATRAQQALQLNSQIQTWLDYKSVSTDDLNAADFQWATPSQAPRKQQVMRAA